jgi:glycosyltransferase involved in cell wall biosynthesis
MIKIALVVQRYGKEVLGGAETLARDVAERLNASGCDVTVFTTTAKDYITWKPHFSAGETILKGVVIKRFDVEQERDIESFNDYSNLFFTTEGRQGEWDEARWIKEQGPYAPALIEALQKEQDRFDVIFFVTYLYYPTIEGLKAIQPGKPAVLFPTAHDELPIYLDAMIHVFKRPDGLFFLTGAEKAFVEGTFKPPGHLRLIRSGMDIREDIDSKLFQRNYLQYAPYILYAGRIERGKGLEPVFEAYRHIRENRLIEFVLMGKKLMDIPEIEGLKYVGFVSEEEKLSAFKGAVLSVQPSPVESLSITTLESFSQGTPVLVNKQSAVLCEHVDISGGGEAYGNVDEFSHHFYTLYDNRKQRKQMGLKGYEYVTQYFTWDAVIHEIKAGLQELK